MRFRIAAFTALALLCALFAPTAVAQYTTVSASYTGGTGHLVANGTVYWQLVTSSRIDTAGGQPLGVPVTATVTSGAFSLSVVDVSLSDPVYPCYAVTIIDNVTGRALLGAGLASDGVHVNLGGAYGCVQPTGSTWSFDSFIPATPPTAMVVAGPTGPAGPAGPAGPTGPAGSGGCSGGAISGGCTGATTAPGALSNIFGNPTAGVYIQSCSSTSACAPLAFSVTATGSSGPSTFSGGVLNIPQYSGGGSSIPTAYTCSGTAGTDTAAINGYLSTPGTYLYTFGNCATNNQIVLYSNDTWNFAGQTLTSYLPNTLGSIGTNYASITNEAVVSPTTHAYTCALTASSQSATCSTASFTNADVEQSFRCTAALGGGVDLETTIAKASGTSLDLSDFTGPGITAGNFSCTETIRDHDIHVIAGTVSMTAGTFTSGAPQEIAIGHANRVTVDGGNWLDPDGTSNWHTFFYDVDEMLVENMKLFSFSGYGQDGIDFEGPWRNIAVRDITCDTSDDCVALKDGEIWPSPIGIPRNTNGAGVGASVYNVQGTSGSQGVVVYAFCVNASGTCIGSPMNNINIDTVFASTISTSAGQQEGFNLPVSLNVGAAYASDLGTSALIDQIYISHVYNQSNFNWGQQVNVGSASIAANEYYGAISISDVGPDNTTNAGTQAAIMLHAPSNTSYRLDVKSLAIRDAEYTATQPLLAIVGTNTTITSFVGDNPNSAEYNFGGGTIASEYIAGDTTNFAINSTALSGGTAGYLVYDKLITGNHFVGEEVPSTSLLQDFSNAGAGVGSSLLCGATTSGSCTAWAAGWPHIFVGTTQVTSCTSGYMLYDNAGTVGCEVAPSAPHPISFPFGQAGGSPISPGVLGYYTVPFNCVINGWSIEADAGTDTVKFLKVASGIAVPTLGSNSISTSGVSLSTGTVIQSATMSDFTTTAVSLGDIIAADLITTSGTGFINAQLVCQ